MGQVLNSPVEARAVACAYNINSLAITDTKFALVKCDSASNLMARQSAANTWSISRVTVGTSQTQIGTGSNTRWKLVITNIGANTIYVGKTGVTTATGIPVPINTSREIMYAGTIYAIVAAATEPAAVENYE